MRKKTIFLFFIGLYLITHSLHATAKRKRYNQHPPRKQSRITTFGTAYLSIIKDGINQQGLDALLRDLKMNHFNLSSAEKKDLQKSITSLHYLYTQHVLNQLADYPTQ